jgi:aminodeoxyfutalosine synthase
MTERSTNFFVNHVDLAHITDPNLVNIGRKLQAGERVALEDGLACLKTTDLLGLGQLALAAKRARFGDQVFYIVNHHLNYTNICENRCTFCAFHRAPGSKESYLLTPREAAKKIAESPMEGLKEVHLVGGCAPDLDLAYYLELLRSISKARPGLRLKAFTAVEVAHMAEKAGLSWEETLERLVEAGLNAMPGGGAEIFSERVRELLFPRKIDSHGWLKIHGIAHGLGVKTNATMLFGHVETHRERIDHLLRLREQQDKTGGFQAFIPLPFLPANTGLDHLPGPGGIEILKTISVSRLILDNLPHLKAYWVMMGLKLTQTALHFGADDLEGTIVQEKIAHQAGAQTAVGLTRDELETMIIEAGFQPAERDTFHQVVAQ